ncbi:MULTISPECIES: hypothetical protein [Saccharopolyspora]|uniref:Uncharacterized protein n=1 Tax=Saccharopolyspora elongata TaxID=2530387 RepID=A0A4R4ZDV0_9PSEU|nr:hypothetical protein [Saccharopolyspora elongata]TDD55674.1 hypothetical protein E1288_04360 [Saccharopolyspora elongata]
MSRIDRFVWIPVVPMLVLALVTTLIGVPLLGLMLLIGALVLVGFDLWVNSRRKSYRPRREPEPEPPRRREPAREPARRPARQAPPQRAAAPRGGTARNSATRVANQPRRNPAGQGSRQQQRPAGGRPGPRR